MEIDIYLTIHRFHFLDESSQIAFLCLIISHYSMSNESILNKLQYSMKDGLSTSDTEIGNIHPLDDLD